MSAKIIAGVVGVAAAREVWQRATGTSYRGKIALITGAGSGIGRELALLLVRPVALLFFLSFFSSLEKVTMLFLFLSSIRCFPALTHFIALTFFILTPALRALGCGRVQFGVVGQTGGTVGGSRGGGPDCSKESRVQERD